MIYAPARPDPSLPPLRVNLYSDTQTKPSPAMMEAMVRAEVGDEQHGDDPSVHALCDRMAALLGKQAAVFLPSGTMCNQISLLMHCRPGDEMIAHESAHIIANEGGGPGALAGALVLGLRGRAGAVRRADAGSRAARAAAQRAAAGAGGGGADGEFRRRQRLAAGPAERGAGRGARRTACRPTWTAPG